MPFFANVAPSHDAGCASIRPCYSQRDDHQQAGEFLGVGDVGVFDVEATREVNGKTTSETRYFALSWMPTPDILLTTVRDHWLIENTLH